MLITAKLKKQQTKKCMDVKVSPILILTIMGLACLNFSLSGHSPSLPSLLGHACVHNMNIRKNGCKGTVQSIWLNFFGLHVSSTNLSDQMADYFEKLFCTMHCQPLLLHWIIKHGRRVSYIIYCAVFMNKQNDSINMKFYTDFLI